jgi:DNA-binding winged helix-turn-helix (wHTH) protein
MVWKEAVITVNDLVQTIAEINAEKGILRKLLI